MFQVMLLALFVAVAQGAHAAVYKCEVNGKTEFSDKPCAPNAERIDPQRHEEEARARRSREEDEAHARRAREAEELRAARAEREWREEKSRQESIRGMGLNEHVAQLIVDGKVAPGMNQEMVRLAWGEPERVNRSIFASGTTEQWVYEREKFKAQYVHFRDGIVSSVSTSE